MPAPRARRPKPCPDCGDPLSRGGRFCKSCGWDADLDAAPDGYLDGVDVPEAMDDDAYADALAADGLGPRRSGFWGWVVIATAALLALTFLAMALIRL